MCAALAFEIDCYAFTGNGGGTGIAPGIWPIGKPTAVGGEISETRTLIAFSSSAEANARLGIIRNVAGPRNNTSRFLVIV